MTGDASLRRRPMRRVIEPLSRQRRPLLPREGGRLPLAVRGAAEALPLDYRLPVASAQVKSAVLLAGLNAPGNTRVDEPEATRDHTENMLRHFGADGPGGGGGRRGRVIELHGQPELLAARRRRARRPVLGRLPAGGGAAGAGLAGDHRRLSG